MPQRRVEPEWLDTLAPDDPRAMASRRDLARLNIVMRQSAIMAAQLRLLPQPETLIDMGSGDGRFLLSVARRLPWRGVTAIILDRQDIVTDETRHGFAALDWRCEVHAGDIFNTLPGIAGGVMTANLFLHHFRDRELARLLALCAARADAFVTCEPRRSGFALFASRLTGLLGCNDVTRHDAVASVRAGFIGDDLAQAWPAGWRCSEHSAFPFSHVFMARRDAV